MIFSRLGNYLLCVVGIAIGVAIFLGSAGGGTFHYQLSLKHSVNYSIPKNSRVGQAPFATPMGIASSQRSFIHGNVHIDK